MEEETGASALVWVCLYCDAEVEPQPRDEVPFCCCRSTDVDGGAL